MGKFDTENGRLGFIPEAACYKLVLAHVPCSNERLAAENINQSQRKKRNSKEGFSKHFQN
jgi:hypothetical protein